MDGFATSHMMSEASMPEPELLREYLGDPAGRIEAPTVAQEILFGAKGRVHQLQHYLARTADIVPAHIVRAARIPRRNADAVEGRQRQALVAETLD
jgi:pyruvate-ferredoxin/flavodoxin oxidoreductase